MRRHVSARVTEGEFYGAPVPGGWPDRGPLRVLGDALARLFHRWRPPGRSVASEPVVDKSPSPKDTKE